MASLYLDPIYRIRNSVVPLVLFWGTAFAAFTLAEVHGFATWWVLGLLTAPAGLLALLHVNHTLLRLRWALRTYRGHLPELAGRMLRLLPRLSRARVEIVKFVVHLALAAVALLLALVFEAHSLYPICALFVGISMTVAARTLLPPGGVYLASSTPERVQFFGMLNRRTVPGIAALLEVSTHARPEEGVGPFYGKALWILNDYRTINPDDWTNVVRALIEMTALVVVDGRDNTPGVRYEVERLLRNRLELKTVFLTEGGGTPSLLVELNAKSSHPSGAFQIIPHGLAVKAIPGIISSAPSFWVPVRMDA